MTSMLRTFMIHTRRSGWSPLRLAVALLMLIGVSAGISGVEGVLFTAALAAAFLFGTAARPGPFHLRSLASGTVERPVARDEIKAQIGAALSSGTDGSAPRGQAMCIVLQLDDTDDLVARHGAGAMARIQHQLAERIFGEIRHDDTLAVLAPGRFAVFMPPHPRIDLESAVQTTMRLHAACARPVFADHLRLHLTSCAGFATTARLPRDDAAHSLLEAGEAALAAAQAEGPRTVRAFDHMMLQSAGAATNRSGNLDVAAGLAAGEIQPWFQPQICADTGALTGLEALARWHHPEQGVLAPGQFLGEVRDQGQSLNLTGAMIAQALERLCDWDKAGINVPRVSVNLGQEDLCDPALVERITWALDHAGLDAHRLGIEVLETVIARADPEDMTTRNLLTLGKLGCLIDLDDFGTGSASINGIRRFAVNRIKIDRSLVTAVDKDRDQHAMVSAILTMASQLGVDVLAEGVETPGEHSAVAQLGCGHVQGYAIARPMPAGDLASWVLRRGDVPVADLPLPTAPADRPAGS